MLRFIASLGMGGEWSLGVALINELWPDRSRALLAGLVGAAANVGLLMTGLLSLILVSLIESTREILLDWQVPLRTIDYLLSGDAWRLMMIAGALPALLVFFIRLFVPESQKWELERDQGATSHWAARDLWGVLVGAIGALVIAMVWSPLFKNNFLGLFFTWHCSRSNRDSSFSVRRRDTVVDLPARPLSDLVWTGNQGQTFAYVRR